MALVFNGIPGMVLLLLISDIAACACGYGNNYGNRLAKNYRYFLSKNKVFFIPVNNFCTGKSKNNLMVRKARYAVKAIVRGSDVHLHELFFAFALGFGLAMHL